MLATRMIHDSGPASTASCSPCGQTFGHNASPTEEDNGTNEMMPTTSTSASSKLDRRRSSCAMLDSDTFAAVISEALGDKRAHSASKRRAAQGEWQSPKSAHRCVPTTAAVTTGTTLLVMKVDDEATSDDDFLWDYEEMMPVSTGRKNPWDCRGLLRIQIRSESTSPQPQQTYSPPLPTSTFRVTLTCAFPHYLCPLLSICCFNVVAFHGHALAHRI